MPDAYTPLEEAVKHQRERFDTLILNRDESARVLELIAKAREADAMLNSAALNPGGGDAYTPPECPWCPDGHRLPGSLPFAVWVGPERDSDGQPTTLHVAYTGGQHVGEGEAEYVRAALNPGDDNGN
jgi:hypothetical protein